MLTLLITLSIGYGLTETGFNSGNDEQHYKPGSSGVSPSGVHIKVRKSQKTMETSYRAFIKGTQNATSVL